MSARRSPLLASIDRFLVKRNMAPTHFGRLAVNDPRLVGDMRNGRIPRGRVAAKIEEVLAWGYPLRDVGQ